MLTITIPQLKSCINHIAVRHNMPLMIWGPPGAGKSEAVSQAAEAHDAALVDIRLSQYDSVDLRGIPVPDLNSGLTVWNAPATLPFEGNDMFPDDVPVFLFLDEINAAAPAVAAVAYQLINDRRVGEHRLKPNVYIMAAGNREGDKGVTNRMPTPLANRFAHVEVTPDVDALCAYGAQTGRIPPIGVAFLQFRKQMISTFDDALKSGHKAFATPRSWEKAFRLYMDEQVPADIKQMGMTGLVGEGPSAEFWGFHDVWSKLVPISSIIKDPDGIKLPEEAAMRYAVAVSVSGAMEKATVAPLHRFLMRMDPEFGILAWKMATARDKMLAATSEFVDMAKKYKTLITVD